MNEREYRILEAVFFMYGILSTVVMLLFAIAFNIELTIDIQLFLFIPLIIGLTASICIFVKHKEFVSEMVSYLKELKR